MLKLMQLARDEVEAWIIGIEFYANGTILNDAPDPFAHADVTLYAVLP